MSTETNEPATAAPRRRIALLALLALALLLTLRWATRPEQVAGLILDRVGSALGLQISASGVSEYRLRGVPRLVVRDLVARQPGTDTPLLRAERVQLSLPWATLRSRGTELVVQRIEIDAPVVDLAALRHWRASRPPGPPPRISVLTDGLHIERGEVVGEGWSFDAIALDLPSLYPGRPVRARLQGRFGNHGIQIPFDLQLALTRLAMDAALGAFGTAAVQADGWQMPMQLLLSGRLHEVADGIGLEDFRSGGVARYRADGEALPFVFGLAGPMHYRGGRFAIEPLGTVLRGEGVIPTLEARGTLAWRDALSMQLRGDLAGWPEAWPQLPDPIGRSGAPLSFGLEYAGPPDLSGTTSLQLRRAPARHDSTRFHARFRLPEVLAWLDRLATGTPLPPLDGRLVAPELEIAGATLEGVELQFEDPDATGE